MNLDEEYGPLIPPQPRRSSGIAYDRWERDYVPISFARLESDVAERLLRLLNDVKEGSKFSRTLFNDIVVIWVVDAEGSILFAIEEIVIGGVPFDIPKHQTLILTSNAEKLGHPALLGCQSGRIAGEIRLIAEDGAIDWSINNASGRYGLHPTRQQHQLNNVASRFSSFGISLTPDWIPPP